MQMVLAAAQADPPSSLMNSRRPVPPPSLSRKRPCDDRMSPPRPPSGGWVEAETEPHANYYSRYESKRDADPGSDEGVPPTGRRVERKDRKNKREQERRKEINDRFALLSDLLFGSKFSGRMDKTQILDRAIDLVRNGPSVVHRSSDTLGMDPVFPDIDPISSGPSLHGMRPHFKYAQGSPGQPNFSPNYPSNGPVSYHTPFFQQFPPHPNFPHPSESSHFPIGQGRGRCFDCESDGSISPDTRFRSMGSSSGTCRKNGSTLTSSVHGWGSHGGLCGSRKDFQNEDDESDYTPDSQTQEFEDESDRRKRYFASPNLSTRMRSGFGPHDGAQTNGAGAQVALLDTLVHLSQGKK